jgi:quinohemoprotein ethanol dehydrogenase
MVLTERVIEGRSRKVLMQAAKNGYFYVFDRVNGELLSAHPFSFVNWTKGLDATTHRPIANPAADYGRHPALVFPAMTGAHSWQPMSFSEATGFVYIPVIDAPMVYIDTSRLRAGLIEGNFNVTGVMPEDYDPQGLASLFGSLPSLQKLAGKMPKPAQSRGVLRAFDPIAGRVVWEQTGSSIWDGGVLSTAGNLVFRGDAAGRLNVYAADSGKPLKQLDIGTSIMAAPATYTVSGEQYVAVMAGYGGGEIPKPKLLSAMPFPQPPPREGSPAQIAAGEVLYNRFCARCHVFGEALLPDLRRLSAPTHQLFYDIVLNGAYRGKGMARWDDVLTHADAEDIHAYLIDQAWTAFAPSSGTH